MCGGTSINYQPHTCSYLSTQHFSSTSAYNFCSWPCAAYSSVLHLTVYCFPCSSYLYSPLLCQGLWGCGAQTLGYSGWVGGLASGIHHKCKWC